METRMVNIRSTSTGTVTVHEPAYNIHRVFPSYGSVQKIPFETVEQLLWSNGFKNLLQKGFLYIDDMQDKIDLGLEDPDTKKPTRLKTLNDGQILTLLKVKTLDEFKTEIEGLPSEQVKRIVDYAVDNSIVDMEKIDYLKELTGQDIMAMITRNRQIADAEKAERERSKRRED